MSGTTEKAGGRSALIAFANDDSALESIKAFAEKNNLLSPDALNKGTITDAAEFLKKHRSPTYLIVEMRDKASAFADLNLLAESCEPDVKVILCGDVNELSFYKQIIEFGVSEYILKPFSADDLNAAFNKISSPPKLASEAPKSAYKTGIIGTRGGVGATTITANLALYFALKNKLSVGLIDLDPQFGTVSLDFDLEPSRGFRDALEKPERVDDMFLSRLMIKKDNHFSLLSGEEAFEEDIRNSDTAIASLIAALEAKYDSLVFDIPRYLRKPYIQALSLMDKIVIVSEMSVSGLRDAMRITEFLTNHLQKSDILVVTNKVGLAKKHEMPTANFEKSVKRKIDFQIPYEPEIYGYASTGKTLRELFPSSKVLKNIGMVADKIHPSATASVKKSSLPFFAKMKK